MASSIPRVVIQPRRARPFFARHPWVFVTSIERVEGNPAAGDVVDVVSHEGKFIARGLFNPHSGIRARLYRWAEADLDASYFHSLIDRAESLRRQTLGLEGPGAGFRLISSEGDGLSGLTVDRYDRWLVAQFSSLALLEHRNMLIPRLLELPGVEGLLARVDRSVAEPEGLSATFEEVHGTLPIAPIEIVEHGLTYWVDPRAGQKTGFFLDQRENRRAVAGYCRDRRVLDLYAYTGGFALNARRNGNASSVLGVESSAVAVEVARHHASINGVDGVEFLHGDVTKTLEELRGRGETFGVVILDPPKFARNPRGVEDAIKAYLRVNRAAVEVVEPGGVLVSCSCSGLVDRGLFADMVAQVAELSARSIQILEQRGQAADHPVSASCLETEYLKCFICRVC